MTAFEVFLSMKIAELGIIPETASSAEFNALMDTLTPEQCVKAKRKFRKLWRMSEHTPGRVELKQDRPTKNEKRRRRNRVFSNIKKNIKKEINGY